MEKRKNWQLFLILTVILLTGYNILPTVFYYAKPLKQPIESVDAQKIAGAVEQRINNLEAEAKEWVASYCELLHIRPRSVQLDTPQRMSVEFDKLSDAKRLRSHLSRAGAMIPFVPAQLRPLPGDGKEVLIERLIPVHFDRASLEFAAKGSDLYRAIIQDRADQIDQSQTLFTAHIDWEKEQIGLHLREGITPSEQEKVNAIASIAQATNEDIEELLIAFHKLPGTTGVLALNVSQILGTQADQITKALKTDWNPSHPDFQKLNVVDPEVFAKLPIEEKALCLVVYPANGSLFVIAKGFDQILQNYSPHPEAEESRAITSDFQKLALLLRQNGFFAHQGMSDKDLIFEKVGSYAPLLAASRENFQVHGSQKYAFLELSNVEQRLMTLNQIETQIHEDLLKARDEFNTARINLDPEKRYDAPPPTKDIFWSNLTLSARKWLRGDEKKVIRWGLDLSGGKTVQLELRDANGQKVTDEASLKQGMNELYTRVNKMGVSEVAIRQVGTQIVLDFPGSQMLSASDLIQASSMYFHIVNETFSLQNAALAQDVNRFLQQIWNEAVVTRKKSAADLNSIAWKHLKDTELGQTLASQGLQFAAPDNTSLSSAVDETVSKIAVLRGATPTEWHGQTHPLQIVFRNHVLEGSDLEHIRANYDPNKGNYLSFDVQGGSAREQFQSWTSRFSKDKIQGTAYETASRGQGWRMAVVLNDTVIGAPTLNSELRDSAMISGSFTQREINQLAADLKAGSLTFSPHILSEKNVSPELGSAERWQGIMATLVALLLVIAAMVVYYRFAGIVASVAVLFNLLIIWATLQNLNATLSLAGIAGIILNIGMAVDANVLVFERIKEEFALSGKIGSAISAGYKKAYSAIVDSNVTTIIAALILLNFDAGPIKAFAITLIIGIVSSMFTALFMTRYYFAGWIQNPKNQTLKMANWITARKVDFLKMAKPAFVITALIVLVGGALAFSRGNSLLGMDFTGGYSLNIELKGDQPSYVANVEQALVAAGASPRDFQVRELDPTTNVRLLFGTNMDQPGKPFHDHKPIEWISSALASSHLQLAAQSASQLDTNWTAMSGQMSDTMRNHAIVGLLISLVCIFIYLAFRFEYPFAAAATICLLHDVLITLGLIGLLNACGVPVQIDLNTVAAIMTIVGYSLNDTIIIFDRVREEMHLHANVPLPQLVNQALNSTLSRTAITSGTTLLVLIALVTLGGASIFSFSLVMTLGVFFGTLSSWFIAAPLLLYFHRKVAHE